MTPNEVVWYANHKYGEMAYMVETNDAYLIFTTESHPADFGLSAL